MRKISRRYSTGFLFSTPSFLTGAGSVINLAGNYYRYNSSRSGAEADALALKNDFLMIGQDFFDVLDDIIPAKK